MKGDRKVLNRGAGSYGAAHELGTSVQKEVLTSVQKEVLCLESILALLNRSATGTAYRYSKYG
jgi:hypothetical protein